MTPERLSSGFAKLRNWSKTADQVLESIETDCNRMSESRH
jgi:hypothetical protein